MPTRYNVSPVHLSPPAAHGHGLLSVPPGAGLEFSDEEAATLGVEWSETDPRSGLDVERAWKAKRDKVALETAQEVPESPTPAETGKE